MTIGGVSARMAFAAPDRMAVVVPPGLDGGETPVKVAWLPGATLYARVGTLLGDRPASSRQSRLRRRRPSLRHLQRHARAGSDGVDLPHHEQRRARAVRARPRQSDLDGARPRRPAVCVVTIRRPRLSRVRRRPLRGDGVGSRRGVRPGVRRGRLALCRRSRRQRLPDRSARAAPKPSRSIPSSIAAFHLAMSPDGDLYVSAPTLASYDSVRRIDPQGTRARAEHSLRPAAGAGVRCRAACFTSSRRSPVRAASMRSGPIAIPNWSSPAPAWSAWRSVRPARWSSRRTIRSSRFRRRMTARRRSASCSRWRRCRSAFAPRRC